MAWILLILGCGLEILREKRGRNALTVRGKITFLEALKFVWARCLLVALVWILIFPSASLAGAEPARLKIDLDHPFSGYAFTDAFAGLTFDQPVGMATPPGETNR